MIVIHPGFQKTATTTLQDHLFSKHPQIINFGQPYTERTHFLETLLTKPYRRFDGTAFERGLNEVTSGADRAKTWMFSDETWTAEFHARGIVPERLHRFFPEAQILFTIRNQIEWVKSFYAVTGRRTLAVPKPYRQRYVSLENWLEHSIATWDVSYLSSANYGEIIGDWEAVYGKEKVKILLFEDFIADRDRFLRDICGVLDVDSETAKALLDGKHSNERSSAFLIAYLRLREFLLPGFSFRKALPGGGILHGALSSITAKGPRLGVEIPQHWQEILENRYRDGNRSLAERYGLPLAEHGYPC